MAKYRKISDEEMQRIGHMQNIAHRANKHCRNSFLWQPEHDNAVLAKDLSAGHLANIINWIQDHENQYDDGTLDFMIGEARYRRLVAFVKNEPYVVIGDDGRASMVEV